MGVLDRLQTGLVLLKDSFIVIRHNPRLGLFPIISGLAAVFFHLIFFGVLFGAMRVSPEGGVLLTLFVLYIVLTFVSTFFTAALVHQTRSVFDGKSVDIRAGLTAAWERKTPIVIWSLIAATIGIIINSMENSDSRIARVFGVIFGLAWTILTFLIVPVIVFEEKSTSEMFRRSGSLFKETWGETPISLLAINMVGSIVVIPFVVLALILIFTGSTALIIGGIGILVFGVLATFILTQTLQGVIKTALYVYAVEGKTPEEFRNVDIENLPSEQEGTV